MKLHFVKEHLAKQHGAFQVTMVISTSCAIRPTLTLATTSVRVCLPMGCEHELNRSFPVPRLQQVRRRWNNAWHRCQFWP